MVRDMSADVLTIKTKQMFYLVGDVLIRGQ